VPLSVVNIACRGLLVWSLVYVVVQLLLWGLGSVYRDCKVYWVLWVVWIAYAFFFFPVIFVLVESLRWCRVHRVRTLLVIHNVVSGAGRFGSGASCTQPFCA